MTGKDQNLRTDHDIERCRIDTFNKPNTRSAAGLGRPLGGLPGDAPEGEHRPHAEGIGVGHPTAPGMEGATDWGVGMAERSDRKRYALS